MSTSSHQHLERLKIIVLEHELYLPTLAELNDPMDGLPKLALQSEDEMVSFFRDRYASLHPNLTPAERQMEEAIIRYNVKNHTPVALQPKIVEALDAELQNYRNHSLTKRYDKMNLWALYAARHRGYCLEFANEGPLFISNLRKWRFLLRTRRLRMGISSFAKLWTGLMKKRCGFYCRAIRSVG
jgi:hypothetical protein